MTRDSQSAGSKRRVQLNTAEKTDFMKRLKPDTTKSDMQAMIAEWNTQNGERQLKLGHLERMQRRVRAASSGTEADSESFWSTVKAGVEKELGRRDAMRRYEPAAPGFDYTGYKTQRLDPDKIPDIREADLEALRFDFKQPKYHGSTKLLRREFRAHWYAKGVAWADLADFVSAEDRKELDKGGAWTPSAECWAEVTRIIMSDKRLHRKVKASGATFSDVDKTEDRINPSYATVRDFIAANAPESKAALSRVMEVAEAVYRGVGLLMPTAERVDSRCWRKYGFNPEMTADLLSFLLCLTKNTVVQREHLDDHARGLGGLWGLAEGQYVIIWLHSYEMNLELERLHQSQYDFIMTKKPEGWSPEAFWSLVASVHLDLKGFTTSRRPTPVKVPLPVGKLFIFDFLVVHAGMPFVPNLPSLRGHLYWPQVAGRDGESAAGQTCYLWSTYHPLFPAWRIIAEDRRRFE